MAKDSLKLMSTHGFKTMANICLYTSTAHIKKQTAVGWVVKDLMIKDRSAKNILNTTEEQNHSDSYEKMFCRKNILVIVLTRIH